MEKWIQIVLKRPWLIFLLFIIIIYGQTIWFGFALSDLYVTDPVIKNFEDGNSIWHLFMIKYNINDYRPIVLFSYGLEFYLLDQINPHYSHFVNLLLFFILTYLLYLFLLKILKNNLHSILIVLLFIAHPIHVEVVASLKNRDVLFSALFVFLSILCIIQFLENNKKWWFFALSVIFFEFSLVSKLDSIGLLFFAPVFLLYYNKKRKKSPFLFFILLFFFVYAFLFKPNSSTFTATTNEFDQTSSTSNYIQFTENPIVSLNLNMIEKIPFGIHTFMLYIKKIILPNDFCYYYGFPIIPFTSINYFSILSFLTLLIGVIVILNYSKYRGKLILFLFAGVAFMAYALNIIAPVAGIIGDRLVFIPSFFILGFIFMVFESTTISYKKNIFTVIIVILTSISFYRTMAWKNIFTLLERDYDRAKYSYEAMRIAANNYKEFADTTTNLELKKSFLEQAIIMSDLGHKTMPIENKQLQFKAVCEFAAGKYNDAKKTIKSSFRNDSTDFISYRFLGDIYYVEKNKNEALKNYYSALKYDGRNQSLINSISSIYLENMDISKANFFNDSLLKINPNNFAALENNGYTFLYLKDTINAEINFIKSFENGLKNQEIACMFSQYYKNKNNPKKMEFYVNLTKQ